MDEIIEVKNMIYEIRGKQVMLDSDLAQLYNCKNGTKTINQAVNRNLDRFPPDFYFQLTKEEYELILKSQSGTSSWNVHGGVRKLPYVFTEQGCAMLATILKTDIAAAVSINIMRAFVSMRKYISSNLIEQANIRNILITHDNRITLLEKTFSNFKEKENHIFFEGQIYDAYSKIIDILKEAKKEIIIIDSYADKHVLDMISKIEVSVTIILSAKSRLTKLDIDKYNQEYNNLSLIYKDIFHDRFIIIDKEKIYHLGTSLNNAGTKTFAINKISDKDIIQLLLNKIN